MNTNSYAQEIIVSNKPDAAYRALTCEFDKWWTESSGTIHAVGHEMTFRFDPTYWTMRATRLEPNVRVELECVEAHHIHEGLPVLIRKEWEGTRLKWHIQQQSDGTQISFIHEGLVPTLDCYAICEMGWDHFLSGA